MAGFEHRAQMHPTGPLEVLAFLLVALGLPAFAAAGEVPEAACAEALELGILEERRARFPEALAALENARRDPACRAAAEVALARTYNGMNEHKKALAAARAALAEAVDPRLRADASYEIGRALYRPGRRMNRQKTEAAEAFAAAIELSGGEHEKAVRALMRIYRETRHDEELAALEDRHPEIRVRTFAEQRRAAAPKKPPPPAAAVGAGRPRLCATGEPAELEPSLPHFWNPGNAADQGYEAPEKLSSPPPEIDETKWEAEWAEPTAGVVRFAVKVDAEGNAEAVAVLAGLAPEVDEAVARAVCAWTYRPAADPDGEPAAVYVMDTIELPLE